MKTAITFSRQNNADLALRKSRSVHEMTEHIKSVRGRHNLQNCKNL